ncbi:hypothetical protein FHT40_005434 [Mycolicibacterium sp. BK556]|uniref:hypothetical protein n=1 Tax=unclassified Mycolicibacterium TaxID=2636767 RepID=UPI001610F905|nr:MULTISPECIES: hypothetical protein [unclassified Mycolicibacterium]MBB3605747.1 hypothetical protein [Mycolicibacterium sp. BK556]MBB3635756.1 hypothetical protein [Mycolicibacterium sp. BK607]
MRRALGPFLTTGVALVAATVVVANPVAPPSRDMQISTTQLSTSPDLLSPSDKSLLSALTPQLPTSNLGPALAQILAALAADADRISREVSSEVSADVVVAAAAPEQTAYRPEPMVAPFIESANAAVAAAATGFASDVTGSAVFQVLNGLVADTSYLGGKVVEASVALVQVIIRVPEFVITAVLDLLNGDVAGVLETVKSVVRAFFGPALTILDGIRDVLYGRQPPPVPPPTAAKRLVEKVTGAETPKPATGGSARPGRAVKGEGDSARKQLEAPSATVLRPTTASKSAESTATSTKAHSNDKPASGSTRSKAGSARDSKSGASSDSSSD